MQCANAHVARLIDQHANLTMLAKTPDIKLVGGDLHPLGKVKDLDALTLCVGASSAPVQGFAGNAFARSAADAAPQKATLVFEMRSLTRRWVTELIGISTTAPILFAGNSR